MSQRLHEILLAKPRQRLADISIRLKLYILLGFLFTSLLLIGGVGVYASVTTQQLVSRALARQQQAAHLAADINNDLLITQNLATEFYNTWEFTGFEKYQGGFEQARKAYLIPAQEQLQDARHEISEMQRMGLGTDIQTSLHKIMSNLDVYEASLVSMSDQMEALGYRDSGEIGQLQAIMAELQSRLTQANLDSLQATLLQIDQHAKNFYLGFDSASARLARQSIKQLSEQLAAADDAQLSSTDKAELNDLLDRYYDHLLAAGSQRRKLQDSRFNLVGQIDLINALVSRLFKQQQAEFDASIERLQRHQSNTIATTIGLVFFALLGAPAFAYLVTRQVIRPVQALGEAAGRLGAGELGIRAPIHSHDEIGTTAAAFNFMADRLQELLSGLEQRAAERTADLERTTADLAARSAELEAAYERQAEANRQLEEAVRQGERRAALLQAGAEVSRAIAQIRDIDQLLSQVTQLISQHFGFYHVGIFLIDDAGRYAVLRAANSEGGRRMLARQHKLGTGSEGIVGYVTGTGQPRIALDVGEDAVFFDNPDLPDTRSEVALPLRIGGQVIGALDVQSIEEAAFVEEDVAVLTALADQIAIAIENTRLFRQTQQALEEVQTLQRYYVAQEWERLSRQRSDLNAEYRSLGVSSLETTWTPEMEMALGQESPVVLPDLSAGAVKGDGGDVTQIAEAERPSSLPVRSALAVPVRLRGEVIGVLDLQELDESRHWTEEEVAITTAVADQVALALENARLIEETHRRAAQLSAAAEVARDATAILDVEQLLNETVQLISKQFGYYHTGVFLVDERAEYAVLQAASSEGGRRMLEKGHKLRVGKAGIVGYVAATGEPRIAENVGADTAFFNNPDLPDTLSEMALPLKARNRVIGVLDVQSTQEAAFSEDDMAVLQTMADQLASAIANARLFREVRADAARRALINEVLQAANTSLEPQELLKRAGESISRQMEMPSIILEWSPGAETLEVVTVHDPTGANVTPPETLTIDASMDPTMFEAVRTRQLLILSDVPAYVQGAAAQLARQLGLADAAYAPLVGRNQVLGLLVLGRQQRHPPLGEGELSFARIVAANLSMAVENARLYQEAVETAERLAEVDRLKSQFLANMSHELRTPLNSIIGFSRVILKGIDGPLTEMQKTDLTAIYNSGQHLLGLINDVLDLSKIEAGKMELHFEKVDLKPIIKGVMSTAAGLVKDKPIELEQRVPDDLPPIWADSNRIRQILLNLISNADKFTEEGKITLTASYDDECVIISVADTGVGIPQEKLENIFEEFTQVDGSSTRRAGGTGLGLPITRRFVELHGGTITVESGEGAGSTFSIALPINPRTEEGDREPAGDEMQDQTHDTDRRLVLAVDDDPGVISLYRRYLEDQGYQVIGITNSDGVLDKIQQLAPFAIILDVLMPGKDGWQILLELKECPETRHIPVVICSIVSDEGRGFSLGAADYLVKPIMEDDLLAALARLDQQRAETEVLVVDDQADDILLIRRILEARPGYRVIEAGDGRVGIEMVRRHFPDVIILDLMMPELDGFDVLEALKQEPATRDIPVIVVTAKELTEEERRRLNGQVEALLHKGLFTQHELLEDVEKVLERAQSRLAEE